MRKCVEDTKFYVAEGKIFGIKLGHDNCSEHETGIAGLLRAFAVNESNPGFEGRRVTVTPPGFFYIEAKENSNRAGPHACLGYSSRFRNHLDLERKMAEICRPKDNRLIVAAWDENSFALSVLAKALPPHTQDSRSIVLDIYQAFVSQNGIFSVNASNLGYNLSLLDGSKIPESLRQKCLTYDLRKKLKNS